MKKYTYIIFAVVNILMFAFILYRSRNIVENFSKGRALNQACVEKDASVVALQDYTDSANKTKLIFKKDPTLDAISKGVVLMRHVIDDISVEQCRVRHLENQDFFGSSKTGAFVDSVYILSLQHISAMSFGFDTHTIRKEPYGYFIEPVSAGVLIADSYNEPIIDKLKLVDKNHDTIITTDELPSIEPALKWAISRGYAKQAYNLVGFKYNNFINLVFRGGGTLLFLPQLTESHRYTEDPLIWSKWASSAPSYIYRANVYKTLQEATMGCVIPDNFKQLMVRWKSDTGVLGRAFFAVNENGDVRGYTKADKSYNPFYLTGTFKDNQLNVTGYGNNGLDFISVTTIGTLTDSDFSGVSITTTNNQILKSSWTGTLTPNL